MVERTTPRIDLTNDVYGHLTVLEQADDYVSPHGVHSVQWLCQCDCGNQVVVTGNMLRRGATTSCGHVHPLHAPKGSEQDIDNQKQYMIPVGKDAEKIMFELYPDAKPRAGSVNKYRGVKRAGSGRFTAWLTVAGRKHYRGTYATEEEAYIKGRLWLEEKYLPKKA
ncbi:hypothetical protein [Lacticaseibacillus jixiensis]|uniref:hypothetical protein n=1 Tax=Lacticaseibacillus jixiensis TaxID=3231926 RepID=UPI0036F4034C